jgi:radical SAM superfamily enzyme YgiQ (UPF0313 family)
LSGGASDRPIIIMGGPEVSQLPPDAPIFDFADYRIRGEGELSFRALCNRLLTNTAMPEKSAATKSAMPKMAYNLYTEEDLQKKLIYVESSRGCPYACAFCLSSVDAETGVREFPLDEFLAQMEALIQRGARRFKFLDRTFNYNIKRAIIIMEFFLDRLQPEMFVHFEMAPSRISEELIAVMRRFPANALRLEIGIQTVNPQTAAAICRAVNPEKELDALCRITRQTKAIVHADLIAGLPHEDIVSFAAGFDKLYAAGPAEIQLGILKCLPGTAIARDAERYGIRYAYDPPYEVIQTDALSKEALDRIKNFARFWELIVNRNPFPDLLPAILCTANGERDRIAQDKIGLNSVFKNFMRLADYLLRHFGRNWGIDRAVLRQVIEDYLLEAAICVDPAVI